VRTERHAIEVKLAQGWLVMFDLRKELPGAEQAFVRPRARYFTPYLAGQLLC